MTAGELLHEQDMRRLELAEANTTDICERYDTEEYHRLTWNHVFRCTEDPDDYGTQVYQRDSLIGIERVMCPECGNHPIEITARYNEIAESEG